MEYSNEAIELLESALTSVSEAGAREKFVRIQQDKADKLYNQLEDLSKHPIKNFNKIRKAAKEENKARKNVERYTGDVNYPGEDISDNLHKAGARLKDQMNNGTRYGLSDDINKVAGSKKGKDRFKREFGGPSVEHNTIQHPGDLGYENEYTQMSGDHMYFGEDRYNKNNKPEDIEYEKKMLKERIEKAKKNPHVVGGYKLEAAQILIEALDTLLSE